MGSAFRASDAWFVNKSFFKMNLLNRVGSQSYNRFHILTKLFSVNWNIETKVL